MTQHVLLNNIDHRDLKVETARGAQYGDNIMAALTYPGEFRNVQAHYPIVFQKDAHGDFQPVALFGLEAEQNLFLQGDAWDAYYVPLSVERQPFLIGMSDGEPMVHIDLDHPRVTAGSGQPLFLEHGGTTEFLDRISAMLLALHEGLQATPAYIAALQKYELLESFVLDVQTDADNHGRLAGYYTIHEERLAALDGAALGELAAADHLEPTYMVLASTARFRDLIERRRHA
ncbi:SapC family protein [Oleiagrimonas soli]|uniref:Peptidase n=1 Tax=Oleiagrimonas soli TaxID=1543381 RepID=A0A099D1K3_9GAMM|nr:SapC family protein [Oleiagrimonas soli]KGI79195.1 peptidase [Oleiagrimonas soli]MBB6184752.1 hypothetical protein [Oleiagrimonas soli]